MKYKPYQVVKYIRAICYCCERGSENLTGEKAFSQSEIEDIIGNNGWQVDRTTRVLICPECVNDYNGKDFLQPVRSHKM